MARKYQILTLLGLFVVLGILGWATYATGLRLGEIRADTTQHLSQYQAIALSQFEAFCASQDIDQVAACISGIIADTNEDQRAQTGLNVQTEMAQWTFLMLLATIFSVFVTALGVFFVKRTLDATLQAVKETGLATKEMVRSNDIMRSQQRPWLTLNWTVPCEFQLTDDDRFSLRWNYDFQNRGNSPAHRVRFEYSVFRYDLGYVGAGREGVETMIERAERNRKNGGETIFADDQTEFLHQADWSMHGCLDGPELRRAEKEAIILCYCLIYDLDARREDFGYEAGALFLQTSMEATHPFGYKLLSEPLYQRVI